MEKQHVSVGDAREDAMRSVWQWRAHRKSESHLKKSFGRIFVLQRQVQLALSRKFYLKMTFAVALRLRVVSDQSSWVRAIH